MDSNQQHRRKGNTMATTVYNLANNAEMTFASNATDAVIAAYALEHKDGNTWEYRKRYGHLLRYGSRSVSCGDWAALWAPSMRSMEHGL
jgi:hypothetical protein